MPAFPTRLERFGRVGSTQDIVRGWLEAGCPEGCVAVADVQEAGRGRRQRRWQAPPGGALLVSLGFRPRALLARHAWRLPAVASLAMLEAAADLVGPSTDRLALKWPNDIVALHRGEARKVAGVLAESVVEEDRVSHAVIGIGVNVDWPRAAFPPALADGMSSLSEVAGGRVDREALLRDWLARLGPRYAALMAGRFEGDGWDAAQVTTGARLVVEVEGRAIRGVGVGVDHERGDLLLRPEGATVPLRVSHGEVVRCRVEPPASPL